MTPHKRNDVWLRKRKQKVPHSCLRLESLDEIRERENQLSGAMGGKREVEGAEVRNEI